MANEKELKPCKFNAGCDGDIETYCTDESKKWYMRCRKCHTVSALYKNKCCAVTAWNHRQPDTELVKVLEAILEYDSPEYKDAAAREALDKHRKR